MDIQREYLFLTNLATQAGNENEAGLHDRQRDRSHTVLMNKIIVGS